MGDGRNGFIHSVSVYVSQAGVMRDAKGLTASFSLTTYGRGWNAWLLSTAGQQDSAH